MTWAPESIEEPKQSTVAHREMRRRTKGRRGVRSRATTNAIKGGVEGGLPWRGTGMRPISVVYIVCDSLYCVHRNCRATSPSTQIACTTRSDLMSVLSLNPLLPILHFPCPAGCYRL